MPNVYIFYAVLFLCCGYALLRGGPPERIAAALMAAAALATDFLVVDEVGFQNVEVGVFVVDLVLLIGLVGLALKAERYWTLWLAGLHGIAVAGHGARLLNPDIIPWAYAVAMSLWSYPMLLMLAGGTFRHQRRLKQFGADRSWSKSSARSIGRDAKSGQNS